MDCYNVQCVDIIVVQYSVVQYSTVQYSTYSAVQYSAVKYMCVLVKFGIQEVAPLGYDIEGPDYNTDIWFNNFRFKIRYTLYTCR